MFDDMPRDELLAFAISHVRNDVAIPVDMMFALSPLGIDTLSALSDLVDAVNDYDTEFDAIQDTSGYAVEIDLTAIGGTD
jgi:hypothetical protein